MVVANVESPAASSCPMTRRASRSRATGMWKSDPAVDRTTFGASGSTVSPAKITASAPSASAMRMMVPALPGSFVSTHTATKRGWPLRIFGTVHNTGRHTAKMPVEVTASASASAALSVIACVYTSMYPAARTISSNRSAAASVTKRSVAAPVATAASTAFSPSAKNACALRRACARFSFPAFTTRGVRSVNGCWKSNGMATAYVPLWLRYCRVFPPRS